MTPGILGPARDDEARAEAVARQWLERYAIVTRDWWRRERPAVSWRAIYRELRRLELRGEVRRGYFVRGLAGAQFATASAVDALREVATDLNAPAITMSATPTTASGMCGTAGVSAPRIPSDTYTIGLISTAYFIAGTTSSPRHG